MTRCLNKDQVAEILGVKPRTASALMMEMNPVAICGKVRKRYVVTEENLQRWMMRKTLGNNKKAIVMHLAIALVINLL